eukprot:CAMPEP_0172506998 /NCGR_PEP_ID=MMETSP1066-20121228/200266_1 /TAXON_ID=671091 /ORGANISM="Coscinodiscus wailesii, Strain CCMP2513" /LENGTH=112 /DNA_ID=CAMNT_0013284331 /DNA_START=204 /DNA_END=539 /DNA_ORIENTATION=+
MDFPSSGHYELMKNNKTATSTTTQPRQEQQQNHATGPTNDTTLPNTNAITTPPSSPTTAESRNPINHHVESSLKVLMAAQSYGRVAPAISTLEAFSAQYDVFVDVGGDNNGE